MELATLPQMSISQDKCPLKQALLYVRKCAGIPLLFYTKMECVGRFKSFCYMVLLADSDNGLLSINRLVLYSSTPSIVTDPQLRCQIHSYSMVWQVG